MKEINIARLSAAAYAINQHMVREIAKAVEEYNGKFTLRFKKTLERHFDQDYRVEVSRGRWGNVSYDVDVTHLPSIKAYDATASEKLDEHATRLYATVDSRRWYEDKHSLLRGFDMMWLWEWQEASAEYLPRLAALEEEARGKLVELKCVRERAWKLLNDIPKPDSCREMWEYGVRDVRIMQAFPLNLGDPFRQDYNEYLREMFKDAK